MQAQTTPVVRKYRHGCRQERASATASLGRDVCCFVVGAPGGGGEEEGHLGVALRLLDARRRGLGRPHNGGHLLLRLLRRRHGRRRRQGAARHRRHDMTDSAGQRRDLQRGPRVLGIWPRP